MKKKIKLHKKKNKPIYQPPQINDLTTNDDFQAEGKTNEPCSAGSALVGGCFGGTIPAA